MKTLLHYEEDFKVLICKAHGYALQNLDEHLRKHHNMNARDRREIIQEYSTLELLKPENVPLPEPISQPFKALGDPIKALICEEDECEHISLNRRVMAQHCNKSHEWKSTRGQKEYWHEIWVQTFFVAGKQRYFSVRWNEEERGSVTTGLGVWDKVEIDLIKEDWKEEQEKHEKELQKIEVEVAKQDRTGWFNQTGWVEHLSKSNLKHLAYTSRLPDKDEKELLRVTRLIDIQIEGCVLGLHSLSRETRRWLRSARREEPDTRPIARLQNKESQLRYSGYWKRFICYCLRVSKRALERRRGLGKENDGNTSDGESDSGSSGSSSESSAIDSDTGSRNSDEETTQRQQNSDMLFDADRLFLWQDGQLDLAEELLRWVEFGDNEERQLKALLDFNKTFIFQKMHTDPYKNGLVHFLAVLGIDEEMGRLRAANDYSYMLAGMVYDVRVIAVEALLPSSQREEQGEAELSNFLEQRRDYLADGSYGVMSWMLSLLAYGKHITLNHGNAGMIDWPTEEVMTLHGVRIYMKKFKNTVQGVLEEAEHVLWEEMMWYETEERFEVALDEIEDDVTFTKRGFSFTSKASNNLDQGLEWMLAQMQKTEGGRKIRTGSS